MFFSKTLLVVSLALSASAASLEHISRANHHRSLAHRAPEPIAMPQPVAVTPPRKRNIKKRCNPNSSFAPVPSSSAAPPPAPSSSDPAPSSSAAPDNTSDAPSPSPTPSPTPPPAPAPTSAAPPPPPPPPPPASSSYQAPAPSPSPSSSSEPYMNGINTGDGTFYATGLGACGITNTDTDYICAVSHLLFDTYPGYDGVNPNTNPVCGKQLTATYQGKSVTVTVTDRCEACLIDSIDFSPSAFDQLADPSVGRLTGMTWVWS
ncbi:RlpA-like double-psi beta-barrel-protein domain-containing protein-containing protein [Amylocystis lapponica]|nr:RlpA-like double-psi beta-barrel-protein domain-containing protein-containing protein [Amylocystis lapponica]